MKKEIKSLLAALLVALIIVVPSCVKSQSTIGSFTYTARFLNNDFLQMYQGARLSAPTMTLPNSLTTYTSTYPFWNNDNLQIYNAIRGIGDAVSSTTATGWQVTGNALGNNTSFLGSTDNRSFFLNTNGINRLKIDSLGQSIFTHTDVNTPALSIRNSTTQIGFYMDTPTSSIPFGLGSISNNNFGFFTNFGTNIAAFTTNNRLSIGKPDFSSYALPASLLELRAQSTSSANKVFGVRNSTDLSDVFYISDIGTMSVSGTSTLTGGVTTANTYGKTNYGTYLTFDGGASLLNTNFSANGGVGLASYLSTQPLGFLLGTTAGTEVARFAGTTGNLLIGTTTDVPSAKVVINSTTRGFLPPRMTATQGSAISSPAEGLMIYVTNTNGTFTSKGWWGYNGAAWEKLNN